MPLASVIRKVLTGSGECARVDWTLLGLSMAEWGLVWFLLLAAWAAWLAMRRVRPALSNRHRHAGDTVAVQPRSVRIDDCRQRNT